MFLKSLADCCSEFSALVDTGGDGRDNKITNGVSAVDVCGRQLYA